MNQKFNVAILGATGMVGEALLEILAERKFPVGNLFPLASQKSAGATVLFKNKPYLVEDAQAFDFSQVDLCFSAVNSEIAKTLVPKAAEAGCIVIDKSSVFRYDADIPLVIPEVNPQTLENYRERNIIATPNCSTIPILVAIKPIYDAIGIERMNIATYQSVSGAGKQGVQELSKQTIDLLNGRKAEVSAFPYQIAFNVIPKIDDILDNGYTKEEMKVIWETQKILDDPAVLVNVTAVRVPVFYGHSAVVHLETRGKMSADEVKALLSTSPGIIVLDDKDKEKYPTPLLLSENPDAVLVGRVREDISHPHGLNFWIVADNVRKGAALNAIQIAELLINEYF